MNNRYLVSVTTPSYVKQGARYWNSLGLVRSCQPVTILLDFTEATDPDRKAEQSLRSYVNWVEYRHLPYVPSHSHSMVQHAFMNALPDLPDDALVILSDLDVQIQRDVSEQEWQQFEQLPPDRLAAYWNCLETDTLALEAERIELNRNWIEVNCPDDLNRVPCYNAGIMVGRASAFRKLQPLYESLCASFYASAPHRSRCQFLINWGVWKYMEGFVTLPGSIHQHAHLRSPEGQIVCPKWVGMRGNVLCFDGVPVIFRHAFPM